MVNEGSAAYASFLEGYATKGGRLAAALTSLGLTPAVGSDASTVDERESMRAERTGGRRRRQRGGRRMEENGKKGGDSRASDSEDDDPSGGMSDDDTSAGGRFEDVDTASSEAAGEMSFLSGGEFAMVDAPSRMYPSRSDDMHPDPPSNGDEFAFSVPPSTVAQLTSTLGTSSKYSDRSRDTASSDSEPTVASNVRASEPAPNLILVKADSMEQQQQQQQYERQPSNVDSSTAERRMSNPQVSPAATSNRAPPLTTVWRDKEERRWQQQQHGSALQGGHRGLVLPFKCVPFVHSMPVSGT